MAIGVKLKYGIPAKPSPSQFFHIYFSFDHNISKSVYPGMESCCEQLISFFNSILRLYCFMIYPYFLYQLPILMHSPFIGFEDIFSMRCWYSVSGESEQFLEDGSFCCHNDCSGLCCTHLTPFCLCSPNPYRALSSQLSKMATIERITHNALQSQGTEIKSQEITSKLTPCRQ